MTDDWTPSDNNNPSSVFSPSIVYTQKHQKTSTPDLRFCVFPRKQSASCFLIQESLRFRDLSDYFLLVWDMPTVDFLEMQPESSIKSLIEPWSLSCCSSNRTLAKCRGWRKPEGFSRVRPPSDVFLTSVSCCRTTWSRAFPSCRSSGL